MKNMINIFAKIGFSFVKNLKYLIRAGVFILLFMAMYFLFLYIFVNVTTNIPLVIVLSGLIGITIALIVDKAIANYFFLDDDLDNDLF